MSWEPKRRVRSGPSIAISPPLNRTFVSISTVLGLTGLGVDS